MGCTKTDFMRGMQCPRMLWLDKHHPELKIIPEETQIRLDKGNEFGDKAMGMFGPFEEMTEYLPNSTIPDKKKMVQKTKRHIQLGTNNICEAAFSFNGNFCAVDILHKTESGYALYEVKNVHEVSKQHMDDASFQSYIVTHCGINLEKVYVVYHGSDETDPFVPLDITEYSKEYSEIVDKNLDRLSLIKELKIEPNIEPGEQCKKPYECWYCAHCAK